MLLKDIFINHGYKSLLEKEIANSLNLFIEIFKEDEVYPQELKEIYISHKNDEVFFIIDPMDNDINTMSDFWDRKISSFLAFGSTDKDILNKIKYNITQILLDCKKINNKSLENSLTISRKIFIPCYEVDNNYYVEDDDMFLLPFILVEPGDYQPDESMVEKLKECLPNGTELEFLIQGEIKKVNRKNTNGSISKSLTGKQFEQIRGWLEK